MLTSNKNPGLANGHKLSKLPPEIIQLIVSFIETTHDPGEFRRVHMEYFYQSSHDEKFIDRFAHIDKRLWQGKQALCALCATSREFYATFLPHLYRRIYFLWTMFPSLPIRVPLGLLLRTLLTRPDIAELVQDVHFDGWNMSLPGRYQVILTFNADELELLRKAISRVLGPACAGTRLDGYVKEILFNDSGDAIAAITISLMCGLQDLSLVTAFHCTQEPLLLWQMMDKLVGDQSTSKSGAHFPTLRRLYYNTIMDRNMYRWRLLEIVADPSPLLRLPMLETLELYLSEGDYKSYPILTGKTIPTLKNLKLTAGRQDTFLTLLPCFPNLVNLEITAFFCLFPAASYTPDCFLYADILREKLVGAPFAASLRRLMVECYWFSEKHSNCKTLVAWDPWDRWGIKGSLGPLTPLKNLQTLEISLNILTDPAEGVKSLYSLLPQSLKILRLLHYVAIPSIDGEAEFVGDLDKNGKKRYIGWVSAETLEELCAARGKGKGDANSVLVDSQEQTETCLLEEVVLVEEEPSVLDISGYDYGNPVFRTKEDLDTLRLACETWGVRFKKERRVAKGQRIARYRWGNT